MNSKTMRLIENVSVKKTREPMLFFVWSLFLSAVKFARRQRLTTMLSRYFVSSVSRETMIACRRIPSFKTFGKFSPRYASFIGNSGFTRALWKMNSEPSLVIEPELEVLYRNEELEIVVKSKMIDFHISDWLIQSTPQSENVNNRVSFIAHLGTTYEDRNETEDGLVLTEFLADESSAVSTSISINQFLLHPETILINNLCTKVGHRRGRPWEILYCCDVKDFIDIAFAWSENSLLDIDGKACVRIIETVHLPETLSATTQSNKISSEKRHAQSLKGLEKISAHPLTLLQILYRNDSEEEELNKKLDNLAIKYNNNNDTLDPYLREQLNRSSPRISRSPARIASSSEFFRYRTYSLSPNRSILPPRDPLPLFIERLRKSRKSTNTINSRSVSTLTDLSPLSVTVTVSTEMDDNLEREVLELDGSQNTTPTNVSPTESWPNLNSKPSLSTIKPHISSRFTMSTVLEDELAVAKFGLRKAEDEIKRSGSNQPSSSIFKKAMDPLQDSFSIENKSMLLKKTNDALTKRRHSSMFPPISSRRKDSLGCLNNRRRSLSPLAFHTFPGMSSSSPAVSLLRPENFRRQSVFQIRRFTCEENNGRIQMKPPTILVFTGDNENLFERLKSSLSTMVASDTYAIFHLSIDALHNHPWICRESACLLIADTTVLDEKAWTRLQEYFRNSGKLLFVCQNNLLVNFGACKSSRKSAKLLKSAFGERHASGLGKDFETFLAKALKSVVKHKSVNETYHAKDLVGGRAFSIVALKTEESPFLLYMESEAHQASALFSDATLDELLADGAPLIVDALSRLSIKVSPKMKALDLSQGYLICENDRMPWKMKGMYFDEKFGNNPEVLIKKSAEKESLPKASTTLVPVEYRTRQQDIPDFDSKLYFNTLVTQKIGKAVFYLPICETTQNICQSLALAMPEESVVVIACQQTKGKGRSGNQWLSPPGCATFSFNYVISPDSNLSKNAGFIQHIFGVAMVDGIRSLYPELSEFPLKIKWPNDIYYERLYKMGGLLVNATMLSDKMICILGGGLNVANSKPTVSVNDMLPVESDIAVKIEEFIANTLSKFEFYVDVFENEGREAFLRYYYDFWLHSREEVTLAKANEKVVIRGLDEHGYLEVRSRQNGRVMCVHPDGNTFDMMKGLISVKY